ncbi:hypothetical protein PV10_08129 [Exophiala mesophila]|uniref:Uncharacterized protein n=1 Tax=Exophiala mesophila TaxID=212818 RepID=A0A0D1XJR5_EXOME|nr:uncharacterized protein PV10_08129 [Exophiala mesophila]KIV88446.1 hypothetical protein PV10_08129 [Exophiala mesophila]
MNLNSISFPSASSSAVHQSADPARRTAEAKAAFVGSLKSTGASSITEFYSRADDIHTNSKALAKQEETVQKETKKLAKENDSLEKFLDKTAMEFSGLKDLEALMAELEADFGLIEETLRLVEADDQEEVDSETRPDQSDSTG